MLNKDQVSTIAGILSNRQCDAQYGFLCSDKDYDVLLVDFKEPDGDGSSIKRVYKITDKSNGEFGYIEYKGTYSSWDSTEYDSSSAVFPKEKLVLVYEENEND